MTVLIWKNYIDIKTNNNISIFVYNKNILSISVCIKKTGIFIYTF